MAAAHEDIRDFLRREPAVILVEVTGAAGSTPRDTDAWMLVSERAIFATIGGGQLEYMAIDHARRALRSGHAAEPMNVPLGPEIGQCCGGRAGLSFAGNTMPASRQLRQPPAGKIRNPISRRENKAPCKAT